MGILELDRTIIPACDVDFETYKEIVNAVKDVDKVRAVKLGFALGYEDQNLKTAVQYAKDNGLRVIFDHQKAGTDIHVSTPQKFMDLMYNKGVNAVILFPESGPVVQYEWTNAAKERGLGVIIGAEMTHPRFLEGDFSNGKKDNQNYTQIFKDLGFKDDLTGYIRTDAIEDILKLALRMGIRDFVMPGNKPDRIKYFREMVLEDVPISIYSPGLIAQGGDLKEGAKAAGKSFHGIVGRGIFNAKDMKQAAIDLTSKL